eukprot:10217671-Heterocapsa_arctica.AAC.1
MGVMGRGAGALGVHLEWVVVKAPASVPCSIQAAPGRRTNRGPPPKIVTPVPTLAAGEMPVRSGVVMLGSLGSRRRSGCARMLAIAHAAKSDP